MSEEKHNELVEFAKSKIGTPGKVVQSEYLAHRQDALRILERTDLRQQYVFTIQKLIEVLPVPGQSVHLVHTIWAALLVADRFPSESVPVLYEHALTITVNAFNYEQLMAEFLLLLIRVSRGNVKDPRRDELRKYWTHFAVLAYARFYPTIGRCLLTDVAFRTEFLRGVDLQSELSTELVTVSRFLATDTPRENLHRLVMVLSGQAVQETRVSVPANRIQATINELSKALRKDIIHTLNMVGPLRDQMPEFVVVNTLAFVFPGQRYTSDKFVGTAVTKVYAQVDRGRVITEFLRANCVPEKSFPIDDDTFILDILGI